MEKAFQGKTADVGIRRGAGLEDETTRPRKQSALGNLGQNCLQHSENYKEDWNKGCLLGRDLR